MDRLKGLFLNCQKGHIPFKTIDLHLYPEDIALDQIVSLLMHPLQVSHGFIKFCDDGTFDFMIIFHDVILFFFGHL